MVVWIYLITARGQFWRASVVEDAGPLSVLRTWPSVVAVIPARNEEEFIAKSLGSLLDLDYPGSFHVVVVDDQSTDDTAAAAAACRRGRHRVTILPGRALPGGWTGKVWAMHQGALHAEGMAEPPRYLLFTDADIAYAPDSLRRLVVRAETAGLALTSVMAKLRCQSAAERGLIPAFVFFFQMLFPFAWVNQAQQTTAAAAGGCMLVARKTLADAGGLTAIRDRLIDDCALAGLLKPLAPIWLGLSERVRSLRPYPRIGDVARMVSRSAYEQLGRSPVIVAATLAAMALTYLVPPVMTLFSQGPARLLGAATWLLMAASFQPILRFYRVSPAWGLLLPAIACAYMVFTLRSAFEHARGRGGLWKGRVQANISEYE
jgi:hopene-associated glycosyltransferase HpnB